MREGQFIRATSARLAVTPIGSCRITTPIRMAQDHHGVWLNRSRNYGYCHTSAEALQMARFLQADFVPPIEVWPLMARGLDYDVTLATSHLRSDVYVVEVSSAKQITIDGVCIQLNYLQNAHEAFFADHHRGKEFWALAASADTAERQAFLERSWPGEDLAADREILATVRMSMATPEELSNDLSELAERLPNLLVVTHVNAAKQNGKEIATRAAFIELVKDTARELDIAVYDPTTLMHQFGQAAAMANDSAGLAHFTDHFSGALGDEWARIAFEPVIDNLASQSPPDHAAEVLQSHVTARLERGRIARLTDRLDRVSVSFPTLSCLPRLKDAVGRATDQKDKRLQSLWQGFAASPSDVNLALEIIDAALEIQEHTLVSTALHFTVAEGSVPTLDDLISIAHRLLIAGDLERTVEVLDLAILQNDAPRSAVKMLSRIVTNSDVQTLPAEKLERLLPHLEPDAQIKFSHLSGEDTTPEMDQISADQLVRVVTHLTDQRDFLRAADIVTDWKAQNPDEPVPTGLTRIFDNWVSIAQDIKTMDLRLPVLSAVIRVLPRHPAARAAMHDVRQRLRAQVRTALNDKDIVRLDALALQNALLPQPLGDIELQRARLLFALGDHEGALAAGQKAAAQLPDNLSVWVLTMRAAAKTGHTETLSTCAKKVLALSAEDTARFAQEADTLLQQNATV